MTLNRREASLQHRSKKHEEAGRGVPSARNGIGCLYYDIVDAKNRGDHQAHTKTHPLKNTGDTLPDERIDLLLLLLFIGPRHGANTYYTKPHQVHPCTA